MSIPILSRPRAQALADGSLLDVRALAAQSPALQQALEPYKAPLAITPAALAFVERIASGEPVLNALANHLALTAVLLTGAAARRSRLNVYADENDALRLAAMVGENRETELTLLLESEDE